jgi:hypothetical protein
VNFRRGFIPLLAGRPHYCAVRLVNAVSPLPATTLASHCVCQAFAGDCRFLDCVRQMFGDLIADMSALRLRLPLPGPPRNEAAASVV